MDNSTPLPNLRRPPADGPRVAKRRVAVVGAGYAGLSAALTLADAGLSVTVFERRSTVGGRARSIKNPFDRKNSHPPLDNGQHALTGAHRYTLDLIARFHEVPPLLRMSSRLCFPGDFDLARADLPAPLDWLVGFWRSPQCGPSEWVSATRLAFAARFRQPDNGADRTVADLCRSLRLSPTLVRFVVEPLCLAAMNAEIETASAALFLKIVEPLFLSDRIAADFHLPTVDLTTLLPQPIVEHLEREGHAVCRRASVESIETADRGFWLTVRAPDASTMGPMMIRFDGVVCAVGFDRLPALIAGLPGLSPIAETVAALRPAAIDTLYLQYPNAPTVRLSLPMVGLVDSAGQWAFDLGQIQNRSGLIAVVRSAAGRLTRTERDAAAESIADDLIRVGLSPAIRPKSTLWTAEPLATWLPSPNQPRPDVKTPLPGFCLAGDFTENHLPATLEAACLSGRRATDEILRQLA